MNEEVYPRTGDVFWVNFNGTEYDRFGCRPGVIIQNNVGNKHSPNTIVFPLTKRMKKLCQPTHVVLTADESGMPMDSMVLCETPLTIPKSLLGYKITRLGEDLLKRIGDAMRISMPL